jgi:surface protein
MMMSTTKISYKTDNENIIKIFNKLPKCVNGIVTSYIADCEVIDCKGDIFYVNSDELHTIVNIKIINIYKKLFIKNNVKLDKTKSITGFVVCDYNMDCMFSNSEFNGDISNWDVSNVTNMDCMFYNSEFNGDISNWDVSNVTSMDGMFLGSQFEGDISNWVVSNVTSMIKMFSDSQFNGDISNWDVSKE